MVVILIIIIIHVVITIVNTALTAMGMHKMSVHSKNSFATGTANGYIKDIPTYNWGAGAQAFQMRNTAYENTMNAGLGYGPLNSMESINPNSVPNLDVYTNSPGVSNNNNDYSVYGTPNHSIDAHMSGHEDLAQGGYK
jgi:hypothetical protein